MLLSVGGDSIFKSAGTFTEEEGLIPTPTWGLQPSLTTVPRDLMSDSAICRRQACMCPQAYIQGKHSTNKRNQHFSSPGSNEVF